MIRDFPMARDSVSRPVGARHLCPQDCRVPKCVPSGLPDLPILGPKDLDDLRFGLERGVDYVDLSFVRTAADAVMIARGDLSLETPFARVPIVQKRLIAGVFA
jgi:pyruvate kinase